MRPQRNNLTRHDRVCVLKRALAIARCNPGCRKISGISKI